MNKSKIVTKKILAEKIYLIEIVAERIAQKALPGQFVIIRVHNKGERIPLTIVKKNTSQGTITLIFQVVGKTTTLLSRLDVGDTLHDIVGPLGCPTQHILTEIDLQDSAVVVLVGGGVGVAEILPVAELFKEKKHRTVCIIGARTKDSIILEHELRKLCDELHISTDDGSCGYKGFVSDFLNQLLNSQLLPLNVQLVYAVGPVGMMKAVCNVTKQWGIKTVVSLNPIMVDGTGMCGSCRVKVAGKRKFACVDGPEFNGHLVDWLELESRLKLFIEQEKISLNI